MAKTIGTTPRILFEGTTKKQFINERYVSFLIESGFNVIMLTTKNPKIDEVLSLCDGFLITGGADVDPVHFNEQNIGLSKNCDADLDEIDKAVTLHAIKYKKPLLGICRGIQSINVFTGGSLHQDIGNTHSNVKNDHFITTFTNQVIDFKKETINCNSYHHQAIKDLAPDFQIIAKKDDIIEAIVHKELPIIGIQWHPEVIPSTTESKIIFDCFKKLFK